MTGVIDVKSCCHNDLYREFPQIPAAFPAGTTKSAVFGQNLQNLDIEARKFPAKFPAAGNLIANLLPLLFGHLGRALFEDLDSLRHGQVVGKAFEVAFILLLLIYKRLEDQSFAGEV